MAIYSRSIDGPLRQGEILSNVTQTRVDPTGMDSEDGPVVHFVAHPWAIIASQDCDLDWDYRARANETVKGKDVPNVLLCEANTAEAMRSTVAYSKIWDRIKMNKDERYHFFQRVQPEEDAIDEGIPELAVDFKRYFTIPTEEMYYRLDGSIKRRSFLQSPYLEHFAIRFSYFLMRTALPEDHFSEPMTPQNSR